MQHEQQFFCLWSLWVWMCFLTDDLCPPVETRATFSTTYSEPTPTLSKLFVIVCDRSLSWVIFYYSSHDTWCDQRGTCSCSQSSSLVSWDSQMVSMCKGEEREEDWWEQRRKMRSAVLKKMKQDVIAVICAAMMPSCVFAASDCLYKLSFTCFSRNSHLISK